jgi:hypothetical protein
MTENKELVEFQKSCNAVIYESMMSLYAASLKYVDQDTAIGVLISALSTNLGVLMAQLPENLEENWNKVALQLTGQSIVATTEQIDSASYGHIGHA